MTAERMPPARSYAKPVVVPARLDTLVCPTTGVVHLPRHLKWSGSALAAAELSADWRAHAPVMSSIGPVLHPDDAVANKMCALFGRAEARDFLDADAAIQSGRYTRAHLLELAAAADGGFDPIMFGEALGALRQITDADFDLYGISLDELAALRKRFAEWREELHRWTPQRARPRCSRVFGRACRHAG